MLSSYASSDTNLVQSLTSLDTSPRFAMIVSRFNENVTSGLKQGALKWLEDHHIDMAACDIFEAPGAFEMPLLAQTLAQTGRYQGVICLGCVIKGETAHFEFISLGSTMGLMQASLRTDLPISFGILTVYDHQQALIRSREDAHNKGAEAASACVESFLTIKHIHGHS